MPDEMRVLIDAVGVPGQGGGAVVTELIRWIPAVRPQWRIGVCLPRPDQRDYVIPGSIPNLEIVDESCTNRYPDRIRWALSGLPGLVARWRADAVLSLSNLLPAKRLANAVLLVHQPNILAEFSRTIDRSLRVRLRHFLLRQAILSSARKARAVMVQTQQMKQGLIQMAPSLKERLHVIPSGYRSDLSQWPIRDSLAGLLRGEPAQKNLAYIAYPRPHKNHLRLLQAWRLIHERLPDWKLVLTLAPDANYQGLGIEVRDLFNLIESGGLARSVILTGNLNPAEVDFTLRQAEALVFPSLAESFGLPLVEALQAECPILSSDLPFAREIAADAALYFNPLREQEMAEKILNLAQDAEARKRLRLQGRRRAPLFAYEAIAQQICQVLANCSQGVPGSNSSCGKSSRETTPATSQ